MVITLLKIGTYTKSDSSPLSSSDSLIRRTNDSIGDSSKAAETALRHKICKVVFAKNPIFMFFFSVLIGLCGLKIEIKIKS